MRCKYKEVRHECGEYLDIDIFPIMQAKHKASGRSKRFKPTSATMARYNQRCRETRLERLVMANFMRDGLFFTPTYRSASYPKTDEEGKKNLRNFLRRLKSFRKKKGLPDLKYIAKTERGTRSRRLHHHLIINCADMSISDLENIWGLGYSYSSMVIFDKDGCPGLCKYFCKGKKKAIMDEDEPEPGIDAGNSWSRSRNLVEPKVRTNENKISKKTARELCQLGEDAKDIYERIYPGYSFSSARTLYNELNGGYYIGARLRKKPQPKPKQKRSVKRGKHDRACRLP